MSEQYLFNLLPDPGLAWLSCLLNTSLFRIGGGVVTTDQSQTLLYSLHNTFDLESYCLNSTLHSAFISLSFGTQTTRNMTLASTLLKLIFRSAEGHDYRHPSCSKWKRFFSVKLLNVASALYWSVSTEAGSLTTSSRLEIPRHLFKHRGGIRGRKNKVPKVYFFWHILTILKVTFFPTPPTQRVKGHFVKWASESTKTPCYPWTKVSVDVFVL